MKERQISLKQNRVAHNRIKTLQFDIGGVSRAPNWNHALKILDHFAQFLEHFQTLLKIISEILIFATNLYFAFWQNFEETHQWISVEFDSRKMLQRKRLKKSKFNFLKIRAKDFSIKAENYLKFLCCENTWKETDILM